MQQHVERLLRNAETYAVITNEVVVFAAPSMEDAALLMAGAMMASESLRGVLLHASVIVDAMEDNMDAANEPTLPKGG